MLNKLTKNLLDGLADALAASRMARRAINRLSDRINGQQFGAYSFEDEVALALSFAQGGVVIDGGANQGDYATALLAQGGNPVRQLVMVEPNPYHIPTLQRIEAAHPGTVVLEPVALGAQPGRMNLHYDRDGSGVASLYARDIGHHGVTLDHTVEVGVDTLDNLAARHLLQTIDYLKLDLEGHELAALQGAAGLLDGACIRALVFEFGGCNIDSRTFLRDFWRLLGDRHGFTLYRILPRRRLLELERNSERDERLSWQNILACAPGVSPGWRVLRVLRDRDALEEALDRERRMLMRADERRLADYADAASAWQAAWPGVRMACAGLRLLDAHQRILQATDGVLPFAP
jgi:FkbM family methyltransferase